MSHWTHVSATLRSVRLLVAGLLLFALALGFRRPLRVWFEGAEPPSAAHPATSPGAAASSDIDHYTCSMHPTVRQAGPGKCPICGMTLVPVTRQQMNQGVVTLDEKRRQLSGVRTHVVTEGPMRRSLRAVGQVTYDESRLTDVTLKVRGWVTKLFVNETGQRVSKGQPLFLFYSPELYNAEQDYLLANQRRSATVGAEATPSSTSSFGQAARQRLHLLGLADAQIEAIERSGVPAESVPILAPASGFVLDKQVVEGASVDAGARLYRIAALDKVWIEAAVYEQDLASVRVGQSALVTLDYLPGRSYDAKVNYVYPTVDPASRAGRVRVELVNHELDLRPGMYASVELESDQGSRVQVPMSAVVYTGPRRLVFVDLGKGRFSPREIRIGAEANGNYEVLAGLQPGEIVATSGVFLIAAEARIGSATTYWDSSPEKSPSALPVALPSSAPAVPAAPAAPAASPLASSHEPSVVFSCPMHPEVRRLKPGKCPKCGMTLKPIPSERSK